MRSPKCDSVGTEVEFTDNTVLEVLQKAVSGYIESVYLTPDLIMWVNEEGKLKHLPLNIRATQQYVQAVGSIIGSDVIVGDVIFTGGVNREGNTKGLNDRQISNLKLRLRL
jgi:hypothetical protein